MNKVERIKETAIEYYDHHKTDLLRRWDPVGQWWDDRLARGVDPFQKIVRTKISPTIEASYRDGAAIRGLNFASQDYLSLSSHPAVIQAAVSAVQEFGTHSAGSATLMGNTELSVTLERKLAEFLGYKDCVVFPIGWAAGYGAVKTLVTERDHVVIDVLAHACLQEAAADATKNIHRFPHLSTEAVERRLVRIRELDASCGILVVTETLFSMDSDVPEVLAIQELCRKYNATLFVDCAHDLGAFGEKGQGLLAAQGLMGKVDVLMGSFSKTFAATGGFVATNSNGLRFGLRGKCGPSTFTNAISPIQCAVVLKALEIVRSDEGSARRARLIENICYLRRELSGAGFRLLGVPSPIVPVVLGEINASRAVTRLAIEMGAIVNLVEHPAVASNKSRWRLQVMADHETGHLDKFVEIAARARALSQSEP